MLLNKIRRELQQKMLEEKLMNAVSSSCTNLSYPEAMNAFIKDFLQKAGNEIQRNELSSLQHTSFSKR